MNRIEMAEYIMREFRKDTRKVVDVTFSDPLGATIHLEDGKQCEVMGKFAYDLKYAEVGPKLKVE